MDTILKLDLIKKAQKYLLENPQDVLHDISHHARVVSLANEIMLDENSMEIDKDLVEIICWWHDVSVPEVDKDVNVKIVYKTSKFLKNLIPQDRFEIVEDAIINHEFGLTPKFIEGKVLQDADKLELLSYIRVDNAVDGVKAGLLERDKILHSIKYTQDHWLPVLLENFHFNFSKNYYKTRIEKFTKYLNAAKIKVTNL